MRYVIVGPGAVGGTIGGRLFEHGHDVLLVARGAHAEALRTSGLRLETPAGARVLRVPVAEDGAAPGLRAGDVLVLAVKTQHTVAALDALAWLPVGAGVAATELPVVCAQNGVTNERMALRRFRSVYAMHVVLPALHLEPGVVEARGEPLSGVLDLGRFPSGTDEVAERVAADLSGSGFDAVARPDIMRWKYTKLLRNLANAIDAALAPGAAPDGLYDEALAEAHACLAAAGIEPVDLAEDDARRRGRLVLRPIRGAARPGGSSWQSLARGAGSIEVDYLNGEIVLLGRMHGVPTPVNEALQRLADEAARAGRAPRTVTREEVLRALGR